MPAPIGSQAIFTAFDLNVKAPSSSTRDTKGPSFLPGIHNKKFYTMAEVEEAMIQGRFSDHQKKLIREGPCGATWIVQAHKDHAGDAANPTFPLDSKSFKRTLVKYTGHCLNTGDGKGGGSGGLYHLCHGVATMAGVKAWLGGCTKQGLRDSAVGDEPNASFLSHADWDMLQVENPGAPPAPPAQTVPQQTAATGAHFVVPPKAPDGGEQSSATGSGGGKPPGPSLFKFQKFGRSEMFEDEQWRDGHQQRCQCGGLVPVGATDSDQVETDVEDAEAAEAKKRPGSPRGAAAEEPKKARFDAPVNTPADPPAHPVRVNVRIQNERGGESMVVFNQVQFRMYESLKSEDARFMEKIASPEYCSSARAPHRHHTR